jgi:tetratricopeptide (TPR) repeat protein
MMVTSRESRYLVVVFAGLLISQSCADTKGRQSADKPVRDTAASTSAATARGPDVRSARRHMDAGEYQQAIDDYHASAASWPRDRELASEFAKSVERIMDIGDKAFDGQDFATAGRAYAVLLKNHRSFRVLVPAPSLDEARLNERLAQCKEALSTKGFQEYRNGNISGAIALWQSLLAFDPGNTDIRGALRTAKQQQKNLQEGTAGK